MLYLASPYTKNPERNFRATLDATGQLIRQGVFVFSPIVHGHPIDDAGYKHKHGVRVHHSFAALSCSKVMAILRIDGWSESAGVEEEIHKANDLNIPTLFCYPDNISNFVEIIQKHWPELVLF